MAGKGRQTARKPATKFAHLRKKMEKNRVRVEARQEERVTVMPEMKPSPNFQVGDLVRVKHGVTDVD